MEGSSLESSKNIKPWVKIEDVHSLEFKKIQWIQLINVLGMGHLAKSQEEKKKQIWLR